MSSSEADSKIDLLDSSDEVKKKIKKAFCEPGNIQDNGILAFAKHVIFPIFGEKEAFRIERQEQFGGNLEFATFSLLQAAFAENVSTCIFSGFRINQFPQLDLDFGLTPLFRSNVF